METSAGGLYFSDFFLEKKTTIINGSLFPPLNKNCKKKSDFTPTFLSFFLAIRFLFFPELQGKKKNSELWDFLILCWKQASIVISYVLPKIIGIRTFWKSSEDFFEKESFPSYSREAKKKNSGKKNVRKEKYFFIYFFIKHKAFFNDN